MGAVGAGGVRFVAGHCPFNGLPVQADRLRMFAHPVQGEAEVVTAGQGVRMHDSQHTATVGEGLPQQRHRFCMLPRPVQGTGEVVTADERVRVRGAQDTVTVLQGLPEQTYRLSWLAHSEQGVGQVVTAGQSVRMLGTQGTALEVEDAFVEQTGCTEHAGVLEYLRKRVEGGAVVCGGACVQELEQQWQVRGEKHGSRPTGAPLLVYLVHGRGQPLGKGSVPRGEMGNLGR